MTSRGSSLPVGNSACTYLEVTWQDNPNGLHEIELTYMHGESKLMSQTSWESCKLVLGN